jgi:hypothetical protein
VSPSPRRFTPVIGPDGSLDPSSLADMGERWVLSWLRERLAGRDPHLPLDRRSGEDPDAKVVGLLRSAGPLHPASRLIGKAIARLLREAGEQSQNPPDYLASLLRVCQQARIPDTDSWFSVFVERLAEDPAAVEAQWSSASLGEIIYAAIQQVRGTPSSPIHAAWVRLLRQPRYTTQALIALSSSFEIELDYLALWWLACPAGERARELRRRMARALALEGDEKIREALSARWSDLPASLQHALDVVLGQLGVAEVRAHANSHCGRAIRNAAQRPDLVLSAESQRYGARCS